MRSAYEVMWVFQEMQIKEIPMQILSQPQKTCTKYF